VVRGVFRTTNNGSKWNKVNAGLTDTIVYALAVSGSHLFAGTATGVWKRPFREITDVRAEQWIAQQFMLRQNYPNPFNPNSDIRYLISEISNVRFLVFDILGREVAVLVNERKDPGDYTVRFEATGLASGVYLYRLTAGSYAKTRGQMAL
jgi:serine protease